MEIRKGMTVKLKSLDEIDESDFDGPPGIVTEMERFFGNFVTIEQERADGQCFGIREDPEHYDFLIRWLEEDENKMKIPDNIKRMV